MRISEDLFLVGSGQFGISSALDCHIYLLRDEGEYIIIDSGAGKFDTDVNLILENIKCEGIGLESKFKIFITHSHADHAGGGKALKEKLTKSEIFAGEKTTRIIKKGDESELGLDYAKRNGFYGDDYKFNTYEVDNILSDGQTLVFGGTQVKCILTPGHSRDSMCYLIEKEGQKMLFTGDVLNHGGKIILLNCDGFDLKDYRENIRKLEGLSVNMLFPGHGVFTLSNGQSHVDVLISAFDKLLINSNLII